MRQENQRRITLVELLVTIAIGSVLAVIMLQAIVTARAAAREASCVQNLREIGLALQNYAVANAVFPISQTRGEGHANGHSAFMAILPYIEQAGIYNSYNFSLEPWHAINQTSVESRVAAFLCPENRDDKKISAQEVRFPESRSSFARSHYGANWGGGRGPWGEDFVKSHGTYLGVMMTVITADGRVHSKDGRPRARNVALADITDGAGYTLAVVEKRDSFGWAVGGWGGSEFDVHTAPHYAGDDPLARKVYAGSPHADGPTALFCDASVRRLPARQDRAVWYALITRAGGEIVKFDE
jgi:type II secretory pathway pseudopilin PulG